jgi:hypothetical protein
MSASVESVFGLAVRAADLAAVFESSGPAAAVDSAGLSCGERFVLRAALAGRSLRETAADPGLARVYGRAVSHQCAANWLAAAGGKLGLDAAEFRAAVDAVADADRAERAAVLADRGGRVSVGELHHDPADVPARKRRPGPRTVADRLEALADELLAEAEANGGTLRRPRLREYTRRAGELVAGLGEGATGEGGPGSGSGAGAGAGRTPGGPGGRGR